MQSRKLTIAFIIITVSVLALDLLTKWLTVGVHAEVIPNFISIWSNEGNLNTGGAWNIGADTPWFGVTVSVVAIIAGIAGAWFFFRYKNKTKLLTAGAGLFIAGALGNVIDRLFSGGVHDFIKFDFMTFPIFNVADIAICFGVILLGVKFAFR